MVSIPAGYSRPFVAVLSRERFLLGVGWVSWSGSFFALLLGLIGGYRHVRYGFGGDVVGAMTVGVWWCRVDELWV